MSASSTSTPVASASPRSFLRRVLFLGGGLIALWLLVQATALVAPATASVDSAGGERAVKASQAVKALQKDRARGAVQVANTSSASTGFNVFSWGNLLAVLLLAGGGGYALYLRQRGPGTSVPATFRPMGQFSLGQSQQLRLVACGGEVLLLGVTAQEVTLLKTFPREQFDDHPALAEAAEGASRSPRQSRTTQALPDGFSEVLGRFVRQRGSA